MSSPLTKYANSFMDFAADLHVPLGASTGRLGDHWADFQRADFEAMAPSLEALAWGKIPPIRRFWIERTKGGSKDSDCAVFSLWELAFAPRSFREQVGAYDQSQASELLHIMRAILAIEAPLNLMLGGVLKVQRTSIVAHSETHGRPESVCEILTSDAYGSHGARPDMVVANELTHVGSELFMQTLLDNADKVPHSMVVVATNAGENGSWQHKWKQIAESSDRWHVSCLKEPAPWVSRLDLLESELRNPPGRFKRLWRGEWSSDGGDALNSHDLEKCTASHDYRRTRPDGRQHGEFLFGGIDLGLRRDHSAICVVAGDTFTRRARLLHCQSWRPQDFAAKEIDLATVEMAIWEVQRKLKVHCWLADPWQASYMLQRLRRGGLNAHEFPFTIENKDLMARSLVEGFRNSEIELYEDRELKADLMKLRFKERFGSRLTLDSARDAEGHADRAVAFAIALFHALYATRNWLPNQFDPPPRQTLITA